MASRWVRPSLAALGAGIGTFALSLPAAHALTSPELYGLAAVGIAVRVTFVALLTYFAIVPPLRARPLWRDTAVISAGVAGVAAALIAILLAYATGGRSVRGVWRVWMPGIEIATVAWTAFVAFFLSEMKRPDFPVPVRVLRSRVVPYAGLLAGVVVASAFYVDHEIRNTYHAGAGFFVASIALTGTALFLAGLGFLRRSLFVPGEPRAYGEAAAGLLALPVALCAGYTALYSARILAGEFVLPEQVYYERTDMSIIPAAVAGWVGLACVGYLGLGRLRAAGASPAPPAA